MNTGPIIRFRAPTSPPLSMSRWRTIAPDAARPTGWTSLDHERCPSTCGGERRCMLRDGHSSLHAWRSLGGLRIFEWI